MKLNFGLTNNGYAQPNAVDIFHQHMNSLISSGKHPYSRKWNYAYGPGSTINTEGLTLIHQYKVNTGHIYSFYEGKHVTALVHQSSGRNRSDEDILSTGYIEVDQTADSWLHGATLVDLLRSKLVAPQEVKMDDRIPVGFWRQTNQGPERDVRLISYQPWDKIELNYPHGPRKALGELITTTPEVVSGKIALFFGPAGTGKTTFLRTLAHSWREWADLEYIIDPEVFLNDAGYITEVMLGEDEERYRVLLLEDSGELVKDDAKITSGQALSRLLNMTDGLLGAGRKVIVAITTNEDISTLHPAVVRPGRCMVKAELSPFEPSEAYEWLRQWGDAPGVKQPMTLAELYDTKGKM